MLTTGEISLYFHIPFCKKKCHYCHFFTVRDTPSAQKLLCDALLLEIDQIIPLLRGKKVVSLYFGGGTPSLFHVTYFEKVLKKLFSFLDISNCEITIEANPDDLTSELLDKFTSLGFNRLSIGVQTLDELLLSFLGRSHGASQILTAFKAIEKSQFTNVSIDLMYDIPQQSAKSWLNTLKTLKSAPITHLSLYNLTIEPNTFFYRKRFQLTQPHSELSLFMLQQGVEQIEKLGLKRYEISAFSKPAHPSKHNLGYWTGRPFLGLGPSAFSFWNQARFQNIASLPKYAQSLKKGKSPIDFQEKLPFESLLKEALCVHLRLIEGIKIKLFQEQWGSFSIELRRSLEKLSQLGLLDLSLHTMKLTDKGLLFYDSVAEEII